MFLRKLIKALLPYGIVTLLQKRCDNGWGYIVFYELWNNYLFKKIYFKDSIILLQFVIFLCSLSNIAGVVFNLFLPKNDDLFLDNIVLAVKK